MLEEKYVYFVVKSLAESGVMGEACQVVEEEEEELTRRADNLAAGLQTSEAIGR